MSIVKFEGKYLNHSLEVELELDLNAACTLEADCVKHNTAEWAPMIKNEANYLLARAIRIEAEIIHINNKKNIA